MTTFHLIRHAEKQVVGRVLAGRRPGVTLSEEGWAQARALAQRLASSPIDRILSSPTQRARETATVLAEARGMAVEILPDLDEVDFGDWTCKTVEELEPDPTWQRYNAFRSGSRIPNGERIADVQTRFVGAMLRLHEADPDACLVLVSHADPIKTALAWFAGAPLDLLPRFEVGPASVSTLVLGELGPTIVRVNGT